MAVDATEVTSSEWEIMRVIWTKGAIDTKAIITIMQEKRDWTESTIKTLLRRLVNKNILTTTKEGRQFVYHANVSESAAMTATVNDVFARLCNMKKGAAITDLLRDTDLCQSDIQAMQAVLADKLTTAPEKVACDCLPEDCEC
ncbi:CopY/TcrY family copper transport repressor [Lapidilactobacillus bayanensis]|uniref:CopY/TcrY family copper transport repressor n=1 Tax=Lapidilactobacillus bayanensis TaxID=2485998 RepID=UPI0013DDEF83|nr:CopY/TcrY family copper transport repressor [Lapidilactobacillus bayanensis]